MTTRSKTLWAWIAATFFGAGFGKPGPGTWGSVAAALLWLLIVSSAHLSAIQTGVVSGLLASLALLIGIPAATIVERESGREDPGHVVLDEVCGQWIALAAAPADWLHALLALLLFRVFDIIKPWPARQLERLHGGAGIMLDDVAAGFYALLVFLVIHRWW
ncbi:phosphatidylglycerophosphatase A [Alloacidobacterium dinghuense]|uniref:Phosphatidylglycerophosphatase A n=1 Tax=Alloacidobacterium dinghuense TaxID=2763107 RepID=A0A7G8BJ72_9BACT|nr:phosphatidylglycerophosphatase A [Alloacidobacterium dinghuense]QNI32592.1 phosphatidylglycerophosphatase A [Alloacidobacterium dinghuense]